MLASSSFLLFSLLLLSKDSFFARAFQAVGPPPTVRPLLQTRHVAATPPGGPFLFEEETDDYRLTKEESKPILRVGEGPSEKVVNAFGLWCVAVSVLTLPIWSTAMMLVDATLNKMETLDPSRSVYDATGKVWSKTWLTLINSYPTISGNLEQIRERNGQPCLYVANHASWLDIPVLCTVLDPVFKFIAKGELRKVPCIGQQLEGGKHILIDRQDRRSQLKTFRDAMNYLKKDKIPIMAFPEGQRSADGRLSDFKRGLFSIAVKAGVPVVPITLTHTAAVMPSFSYFPVQAGAGKIHVHVGDPIDSQSCTEEELEAAVRAEFLQHLPASQLPLPKEDDVGVLRKEQKIVPERELQAV